MRTCRCHFCERILPCALKSDFTDGKRRYVCAGCQHDIDMDAAQEDDEADDESAEMAACEGE